MLMFVLLITACSSESDSDNNDTTEDTNAEQTSSNDATETKEDTESGKTEVVFWHAMGGNLEETLTTIVSDYNASQSDYEVVAIFQGSYEEALTKFNTVAGTSDAPAIMQTFEVGTKYMVESGNIQPVQKFIDADSYDINQWEKNISNYYNVDGTQYSMPFNSSTPVLIYNKDAFTAAGLDAENPPMTYSALKEASQKLTIQDGSNTTQYGFSVLNYGWFFEQLVAVQGGHFVDNDNGRTASAQEVTFNQDEGLNVFTLISDMYNDGTYYNSGTSWDDIRAAFLSGKTAMYLDSSAGVKAMVDSAEFEVGVSYLPIPDGKEREGVIIGGASLWMSSGLDEEIQQGAWDFMKYVSSAEVQADWHLQTGYFAINPAAYDLDVVKEVWEAYPQLKVTVNQLRETKSSTATQGALISVFPEARQKVVSAMESLYQGADPQQALDQAASEINRALEKANKLSGN